MFFKSCIRLLLMATLVPLVGCRIHGLPVVEVNVAKQHPQETSPNRPVVQAGHETGSDSDIQPGNQPGNLTLSDHSLSSLSEEHLLSISQPNRLGNDDEKKSPMSQDVAGNQHFGSEGHPARERQHPGDQLRQTPTPAPRPLPTSRQEEIARPQRIPAEQPAGRTPASAAGQDLEQPPGSMILSDQKQPSTPSPSGNAPQTIYDNRVQVSPQPGLQRTHLDSGQQTATERALQLNEQVQQLQFRLAATEAAKESLERELKLTIDSLLQANQALGQVRQQYMKLKSENDYLKTELKSLASTSQSTEAQAEEMLQRLRNAIPKQDSNGLSSNSLRE